MSECVFVPAHEPWSCNVHNGIRTSLDETQCDIARPAEPFNDAYLDNIRQAIAAGKNPSSRYTTRRLLATIEAQRVSLTGSGLDEERLARAQVRSGIDTFLPGEDRWISANEAQAAIAREYAALSGEPKEAT